MSGGEVVCSGWLRKSPPEKKLRRYAWKKRWFVLRSGRLSGDPDVLEYYKNDHAKKPIRVIDLNLCEQVDAGLTFNKKDLEHSFIFDIKTIDRIFYLVADTEEEMNKWVRCICDICGFNPTDSEDSAKISHQVNVPGGMVVDMAPSGRPGGALRASSLANLPPPYQPVSIRPLGSSSKPIQEPNYVPMTPGTVEFSSLGKQVPPPAHMGFRSSPKTPPRRPVHMPECQPPPVDRNLKPDRKGEDHKPVSWFETISPYQIGTQILVLLVSLSPVLTVCHILALQKKSNGTGISASDERVDYVVVDQHRTQALKSTREAWSDERQSTEQDPPIKGAK
uniref:GRB2-associated binding protein 1 n=1 Tax=Sinocyclocheilus grahami TaxID=75366 RepID=A0A672KW41_SINGR